MVKKSALRQRFWYWCKMHFKGFCSANCELNSSIVHEEALCRLKGKDLHSKGRWLCDEVSPVTLFSWPKKKRRNNILKKEFLDAHSILRVMKEVGCVGV